MTRRTDPSWRDAAVCAQTDSELFFPSKGMSSRDARRVCTGCEVRAECLEHALTNDEQYGIWGGTTEHQRRAMRRGGR